MTASYQIKTKEIYLLLPKSLSLSHINFSDPSIPTFIILGEVVCAPLIVKHRPPTSDSIALTQNSGCFGSKDSSYYIGDTFSLAL